MPKPPKIVPRQNFSDLPYPRTHGPALVIPREDRPAVHLRLVDRYHLIDDKHEWGYTYHNVIEIDGETFTVDGWAFMNGSKDLPLEVRERLQGILPDWDNQGEDRQRGGIAGFFDLGNRDPMHEKFERSKWRWKTITQRLTSERMLWMVATFLVTNFKELKINVPFIERHIACRDGRVMGLRKRGAAFDDDARIDAINKEARKLMRQLRQKVRKAGDHHVPH